MVSHGNIIANVMQATLFDTVARNKAGIKNQVNLALLPLSHIYGLTMVGLLSQYRGDEAIVLPRFELGSYLASIERFRIELLFIVPPILINMLSNKEKCDKVDMSSVRHIMSGAAPLGSETVLELNKRYPKWTVGQGYGKPSHNPSSYTQLTDHRHDGSIPSGGDLERARHHDWVVGLPDPRVHRQDY